MRFMLLAIISTALTIGQEPPKPAESKPPVPALTAEQIMEKAVAAIGDEASFAKIKSTFMKNDLELGPQAVRGTLEIYWKAPNKRLTITKIEGSGETSQGYDGENAWLKDPTGAVRDITGPQLAIIVRTAQFNSDRKWKELYEKVEIQASGKVGGRDAYVLKLTPKSGPPLLRYYDAENFLLMRSDLTAAGPKGDVVVKTTFTDYREVDGVKVPFQTTQQLRMGNVVSRVIEVKNNVPIDDKTFLKPPDTSTAVPPGVPAPK